MKFAQHLRRIGALFALASLAACHGRAVRPLEPIEALDDYCMHGKAKGPGLLSIVSSIGDLPPTGKPLAAATVAAQTRKAGGVVAHWHDLNLLLPQAAKAIGEPDEYLHVQAAALTNPPADATSRPVALLVSVKGTSPRWYSFSAYDVQNVCVEGSVKM